MQIDVGDVPHGARAPLHPSVTQARVDAFDRLWATAAVIDPHGVIIDTNAAWRRYAELNGGSPHATGVGADYLAVCDRSAERGDHVARSIATGLRQVLGGERPCLDLDYSCRSRIEDRWFTFHAAPMRHGDALGAVVFHTDITWRKDLEGHVGRVGTHDGVTGLANRRLLLRELGDQIWRGKGGAGPTVVLLDLDDFRAVNDRLGTAAADALLVSVARRLQAVTREGDLVSRFGGDEFVLVLRDAGAVEAAAIVERLRAALSQHFQVGADAVALSASIGVAGWAPGLDGRDLLLAADEAMLRNRSTRRPGARRSEVAQVIEREQLGELTGIRSPAAALDASTEVGDLGPAHALVDAMVAYSDDVVLLFARDGTIEWVSPACRRIVGVEPSDLVGTNGFDLIHPEDRDRVFSDLLAAPKLGDVVRSEFRVTLADGRTAWVEETITNLLDDPDVGAIVGHLRDITDRRLAEEANRLQARMLDAVGQSIVAFDGDGTIIYWNDAATELLGYHADEAVGRPIWDVVRTSAEWDDRSGELLASLQETGAWRGELVVRTKDGRDVPILVSDTSVYDDDGRHVATIGVSTDLTERIRAEQTSARLSAIVESSADAILSTDLSGAIETWNVGASWLFGRTAEDVVGGSFPELVCPEHQAQVAEALVSAAGGDAVVGLSVVAHHPDGHRMDLEVSFAPIRAATGDATGISIVGRDVTERVALHRQVDAARRRLADEQRCAGVGTFEFDLVTGAVTRSDQLCEIFGVPVGTDGALFDWMHPDDEDVCTEMFAAFARGETDVSFTHRVVRPDGEVRWVISRSNDLGISGRTVAGTVLDVTEQHRAREALEHQAAHDPLTGLLNRAGLNRCLAELVGSRRPGRTIAAAMLDLDQFNTINDTLGHPVGDQVLRAIAKRLVAGLATDDVVTRFGGDEFVVLRDVADGDDGTLLAQDVQQVLEPEVPVDHRSFQVRGCVGVAVADQDTSADTLLADADAAMYLAKRQGRSRIAALDRTSRAEAHRRLGMETALAHALDRGELRLEYQPVVELQSGSLAGFEALLRWTSQSFGEVSPAEFIPIAEASELIVEIGTWVLDTATQQLSSWRSAGLDEQVWVAINVSARQLDRDDFAAGVLDRIDSNGLPPRSVHLEVTESAVLTESSASRALHQLRSCGVRVSIDDFGTGYSSLSYLDRLPVDTLKIDREFVQRLHVSHEGSAIVRTIVALADTLALDVVAEGVETAQQAEVLRDLGCRHGQGFWWSASLPASGAATWSAPGPRRS